MHSRIYYPLATALTAAALVAVPASGDVPTKQPPPRQPPAATGAAARLTAKPGQIVRWRSPNIGPVNRLSLRIGGRPAGYAVEPRTNACVAYGYEAGVAVRITDCRKGKRVRYVRVRATSAALKSVRVVLRLN